MDTRFTGVIPPLITPFTQEGSVDLDGLDHVIEQARRAQALGADAVVAA